MDSNLYKNISIMVNCKLSKELLDQTTFDTNSLESLVIELLNGEFEELTFSQDGLSPLVDHEVTVVDIDENWS
jgi:hypothetical protein